MQSNYTNRNPRNFAAKPDDISPQLMKENKDNILSTFGREKINSYNSNKIMNSNYYSNPTSNNYMQNNTNLTLSDIQNIIKENESLKSKLLSQDSLIEKLQKENNNYYNQLVEFSSFSKQLNEKYINLSNVSKELEIENKNMIDCINNLKQQLAKLKEQNKRLEIDYQITKENEKILEFKEKEFEKLRDREIEREKERERERERINQDLYYNSNSSEEIFKLRHENNLLRKNVKDIEERKNVFEEIASKSEENLKNEQQKHLEMISYLRVSI